MPDRIVAGGFPVFESPDRGTTWRKISEPPRGISWAGIGDLEFDPQDPMVLYGVHRGSKNIVRSTDGGSTWKEINNGLPCCVSELEVGPMPKTVYAVQTNALYKTTSGGDLWEPLFKGISNKSAKTLVVNHQDANVVYAGGPDGVYKSTNAGRSWKATQCRCDVYTLTVDPIAPQNVYAVVWFETDRRKVVLKSADAGNTWSELAVPKTDENRYFLHRIAAHPHFADHLFLLSYQDLYHSPTEANPGARFADLQGSLYTE